MQDMNEEGRRGNIEGEISVLYMYEGEQMKRKSKKESRKGKGRNDLSGREKKNRTRMK